MRVFEESESNVRSYCRSFPVVFEQAENAFLYSESGERYIDFFSGAGALNYGHNNKYIKDRLLNYLQQNNVLHALDMFTTAKRDFMEAFCSKILNPRQLDYKLQFCGPTGANAVEAALKLARKVKNRSEIFSFTGGFHGMSMGALAVSSNRFNRAGAAVPLSNVSFMPYAQGFPLEVDTIDYMDALLSDGHSGVEKPAAIIFETVQAEGGVNVATIEWMQRLRKLCDKHDLLLICDDIQVGCYRTGSFFSFERADIVPDIVVLSKSISGIGFPMSLLLMKPELDIWEPGEHTGTFRGNQVAFVTATAAIDYALESELQAEVKSKEVYLHEFLNTKISAVDDKIAIRGIGMIWGIDFANFEDSELADKVSAACFKNGLIIETAGRDGSVVKLLPSLNIDPEILEEGCSILQQAIEASI